MTYDILITNAKTRASGKETVDIGIRAGKIADIGKNLSTDAAQTIDAKGCLVTESFVNGHLAYDHANGVDDTCRGEALRFHAR